jgi:RsiW-degrading membrane proteinase PrsW (M82 family)
MTPGQYPQFFLAYALYLLPIVLPLCFWAGYHYYKDRHLPEPVGHLAIAFFLGIVSYYLGMLMYGALGVAGLRYDAFDLAGSNLPGLFVYAILGIGIIEELAKILPFMLVATRLGSFNEPIDGIIYASFIALGFSAVENISYLRFIGGHEAWGRGFAGPLIHIVFASVWGYYIGLASLRRQKRLLVALLALLVTAFFHGIYDFIVIALPGSTLPLAALLIVAIWLWRLWLIRHLHRESGGRYFDTGT